MKKFFILIPLIIGLFYNGISQNQPKNIIIVLAHGMGYNHVKAFELQRGNQFPLIWNSYPVMYGVTNYPAYWAPITEPKDVTKYKGDYHIRRIWSDFNYTNSMVVDPASVGTAIATGKKSAYKAVGVGIDSSKLETILERAFSVGKATGIVTNLPLSKSAAASFVAHYPTCDSSRAVFNQLLGSHLSIAIGAGNPFYNNNGQLENIPNYTYVSQSDWNALTQGLTQFDNSTQTTDIDNDNIPDAWTLVQSESDILTSNAKRIIAMPQVFDAIQFKRSSSSFLNNVPHLAELTQKGISHLAQKPQGFVLVVESGSVDYASQLQNNEAILANMQELHTTIDAIQNWVSTESSWNQTLVIIVGTYETGFLSGMEFSSTAAAPDFYSKTIHITQGAQGTIPLMKCNSNKATNMLTPLYANGIGSELFSHYTDEEDYVYGKYINNSEIGQICMRLLPTPTSIPKTPKNIILMINDGVGLNQIRAANYYTGKTQQYEQFPVRLFHSTYPLVTEENIRLASYNNSYESTLAWTDGVYLRNRTNATCSGASGTAIASGTKTYYYGLGVDVHKNAVNTIARHAKSLGKSIGVATNIPISDATPAVFFANNVSRNNAAEITRQLIIESKADVIIGGGHPEYDKHGQLLLKPNYKDIGGLEFWQDIRDGVTTFRTPSNSGWTQVQDIDGDNVPDAWTLIEDSTDFAKYAYEPTPKRLLGIAKVESSMQFYRTGTNYQEVHFDDLNPQMPALWQIARVGLQTVNKNPNGFFLMIEGDAADNAGHQNYKGRMIEEMISFNTAVDTVIAWIEQHGGWEDNLLIVTADHETGLLAHPDFNVDSNMLVHYDIIDNGVGNMPGMTFYATHHSNQLIPLYAKGAGAEIFETYADEQDIVRGPFLNNSEIGQALFTLWNGTPCSIINNKVMIIKEIPAVQLFRGRDTTFAIIKDFYEDIEDTEFQYSITTRPNWLQFDLNTFTFSCNPPESGLYTVKISVSDGKTTGASISSETTFTIVVNELSKQEKLDNTQATVFPIPASRVLHISNINSGNIIELYNAAGVCVYSAKAQLSKHSINIDNLMQGNYLLTITDNMHVKTIHKVIIK